MVFHFILPFILILSIDFVLGHLPVELVRIDEEARRSDPSTIQQQRVQTLNSIGQQSRRIDESVKELKSSKTTMSRCTKAMLKIEKETRRKVSDENRIKKEAERSAQTRKLRKIKLIQN